MKREQDRHRRRGVRLAGYDYSQAGMYFVTVCTAGRACLFGEIVGGHVRLNENGRIVQDEWARTSRIRPRVVLDEFIVMPNHIHGILVLVDGRGTLRRAPTMEHFGKPASGSIPTIIRLFKAATAGRINRHRRTPGAAVWQRGYYEHVIRRGESLDRIRRYIADNPGRWAFDHENPQAVDPEPEDAWARI